MRTIVDVHCHTFNADDLPVRGFLHRLHLRDVRLGPLLSELADRLIQGRAPGVAPDIARLDRLLGTAPGMQLANAVATTEQFEAEVDRALAELQGQDEELVVRLGSAIAVEDAPAGAEVGVEGIGDLVALARRGLRWVLLFGRSRVDLAVQLMRDYDGELDLVTPLLVDLGGGLGDRPETGVREQVAVFEKLSRATMLGKLPGGGKTQLHPFVGFDPLRELRARRSRDVETPLEIVQDAVARYGFVGVKVYPPMGWRPSGNQARRPLTTADAEELDRIVDELAAWCERDQVPITSHGADSNHSDPAFVGFGDPDDWLPVLRAHPGLRLNLGHFGGAHEEEREDGWAWRIARAMKDFDGLYADVGNHRIHEEELAKAYMRSVTKMLSTPETEVLAERLMYGSDWFMLAMHPDHDQFLSTYRKLFEPFGDAACDRFLGGNALRFLGFDDPANGNAIRLGRRYETYAPDAVPRWLATGGGADR